MINKIIIVASVGNSLPITNYQLEITTPRCEIAQKIAVSIFHWLRFKRQCFVVFTS